MHCSVGLVSYTYAPQTQKRSISNSIKNKTQKKKCHATDSISCFQYHNHWPKKLWTTTKTATRHPLTHDCGYTEPAKKCIIYMVAGITISYMWHTKRKGNKCRIHVFRFASLLPPYIFNSIGTAVSFPLSAYSVRKMNDYVYNQIRKHTRTCRFGRQTHKNHNKKDIYKVSVRLLYAAQNMWCILVDLHTSRNDYKILQWQKICVMHQTRWERRRPEKKSKNLQEFHIVVESFPNIFWNAHTFIDDVNLEHALTLSKSILLLRWARQVGIE